MLTSKVFAVLSLVLIGFASAGFPDCWEKCGKKGGLCGWCGGTYGWCCRQGWTDGSCNGFDGCSGYHCCKLGDCWSKCGNKGGSCAACGEKKACCRKGWTADGPACNNGKGGCTGYHCCDKDYCLQGEINDDYEVVNIHYNVDKSNVVKNPPTIAGEQHVNNLQSSTEQSVSFTASETYSETKSFSHTAGASVTVGTEFSVGIPLIASGSVSVEVSASYEFSYGKENSVEKSKESTYNCNAAPHRYVECIVTYHKFTATVPYTITWRRKGASAGSCQRTSSGIFKEVSAFKMHMEVKERNSQMKLVKRTIIPLE